MRAKEFISNYDIEKISTNDLVRVRKVIFNNWTQKHFGFCGLAIAVVLFGLPYRWNPLGFIATLAGICYLGFVLWNIISNVQPVARAIDNELVRRLHITQADGKITWDSEDDSSLLQWVFEVDEYWKRELQ
jgi:hypothetical protein